MKPDFIGRWVTPSDHTFHPSEEGTFNFFIENKKEVAKEIFSIDGRISDILGNATFQGVLERDKIKFTKRYSENAIMTSQAHQGEIIYIGQLVNGHFEGIYTCMFDETNADYNGKFFMYSNN